MFFPNYWLVWSEPKWNGTIQFQDFFFLISKCFKDWITYFEINHFEDQVLLMDWKGEITIQSLHEPRESNDSV